MHISPQHPASVRFLAIDQFFGRAFENELAAGIPSLRTKVDYPVGSFNDVKVVFDHHQGISGVDELVEGRKQFPDVVKMQSGRRLVKHIEGVFGARARNEGSQFDSLRFAAGPSGRFQLL